jgi:uncharacterized membrane protein YeaQ/YmgE (transglycosylase-associated protein family)
MLEGWIVNAIAGAVGGNLAGTVLKDLNAGWITKSIAGIVGGSAGGQLIAAAQTYLPPDMVAGMNSMLTGQLAGIDLNNLAGGVASGGVGGAVALLVWGYVKKMMAR